MANPKSASFDAIAAERISASVLRCRDAAGVVYNVGEQLAALSAPKKTSECNAVLHAPPVAAAPAVDPAIHKRVCEVERKLESISSKFNGLQKGFENDMVALETKLADIRSGLDEVTSRVASVSTLVPAEESPVPPHNSELHAARLDALDADIERLHATTMRIATEVAAVRDELQTAALTAAKPSAAGENRSYALIDVITVEPSGGPDEAVPIGDTAVPMAEKIYISSMNPIRVSLSYGVTALTKDAIFTDTRLTIAVFVDGSRVAAASQSIWEASPTKQKTVNVNLPPTWLTLVPGKEHSVEFKWIAADAPPLYCAPKGVRACVEIYAHLDGDAT